MYAAGDDAAALELIRREWGSMLDAGPGTMWETIDASTGGPTSGSDVDHGWSSGAAPALTGYVLGVLPASPGFATFTVVPHPAGLDSATATYRHRTATSGSTGSSRAAPQLSVTAPAGTTWANAPAGAPVDTAAPTISGSLLGGAVLTASPGSWAAPAL